MTLSALQYFFYYMASASVICAILAVTRKNPVYSVLWVLALFLHMAGIFLLLGAEFLAAVQVIVYAGAILIFYLFVLMLLDPSGEEIRPRFGDHWPFAAIVGIPFVALAWIAKSDSLKLISPAAESLAPKAPPLFSLAQLGKEIFGPFALPFEIVSLVLLAAIVGAVVLVRSRSQSETTKEQS